MKKIISIGVSFLLSFNLAINAQNANAGFEDGYIVDVKGDTLKGFIKVSKKEEDAYAKVTFKKTEADKKSYTAAKIKGYGVGENNYTSCKIEGGMVFAKNVSLGAINLYEYKVMVLLMGKEKMVSDYYFQKSGTTDCVKLKSGKNLKKQLSELMSDNPDVISELENKKLEPENAIEIFEQYNNSKKG